VACRNFLNRQLVRIRDGGVKELIMADRRRISKYLLPHFKCNGSLLGQEIRGPRNGVEMKEDKSKFQLNVKTLLSIKWACFIQHAFKITYVRGQTRVRVLKNNI